MNESPNDPRLWVGWRAIALAYMVGDAEHRGISVNQLAREEWRVPKSSLQAALQGAVMQGWLEHSGRGKYRSLLP